MRAEHEIYQSFNLRRPWTVQTATKLCKTKTTERDGSELKNQHHILKQELKQSRLQDRSMQSINRKSLWSTK